MLANREHRNKLLCQTGGPGRNLWTVGLVYAHEGVDNALGMWEFAKSGINREGAQHAFCLASFCISIVGYVYLVVAFASP
jgi:hypothetical protein